MRVKAQSTIEFTITFICAILFIVLTCNLFVWINHCLVQRQVEYERTRVEAGSSNPGRADFFVRPPLNVFSLGGRDK